MSIETWQVFGNPTVWDCIKDIAQDEDYLAMDHDELLATAEAHAEGAIEAMEAGDVSLMLAHVGYMYGCRDLVYSKKYVKAHGWWNIPLGRQLREYAERLTETIWPMFHKKVWGTYKPWFEEYGAKSA